MATTTAAAQATGKKETAQSGLSLSRIWDQYGMLVIFAILFLIASVTIPNVASIINMMAGGGSNLILPVNLICRSARLSLAQV